jgi:cephalosporin hydroxylase
LGALCNKLLERPPKVIVEIGTAKGGTLYLWTRISTPCGLVVSIDKPGEIGSVGRTTLSLYRRFGRERGTQVFTIAGDSHAESTHRQLQRILGDRKVDFLFIDGDHSYEGVKADFYGYQPYMEPHGMVALHDIAVATRDPQIQVGRFWSQIHDQRMIQSLISRPGESPGIGLVFPD